jgi:glutamate-ammonia-ligase adenylyltransferase
MVIGLDALKKYLDESAWTWELQALTRSRFVAGSVSLEASFNRVRLDVLCRSRDEKELAADLAEMRRKMLAEQESKAGASTLLSEKHRPGGLVDIEFVAQLGVLSCARLYPRVIQATGTSQQIGELTAIDWLSEAEAATLDATMERLRERKMMASLVTQAPAEAIDTDGPARIFDERIGGRD